MFYWLTKYTLGMTLKIVFRPWADGAQNVPRRGPAILASNHLSFSDHFFAPLPLPRKVVFLAKAEYFTGRGLKGLVSRLFFSGVGADTGGPGRGRGQRAGAAHRPAGAGGGSCWASIPRAPGPPTAACTAARPAWPGWP